MQMNVEQIEASLRKSKVELAKVKAELSTNQKTKDDLIKSLEASVLSLSIDESGIEAKDKEIASVDAELKEKQAELADLEATILNLERELATKKTETVAKIKDNNKGDGNMKDRIIADLLLAQEKNPNFELTAEEQAIPGITKEGREVEFSTTEVLVNEVSEITDLRQFVTVQQVDTGTVTEYIPTSVHNRAFRADELTKNKQLARGTVKTNLVNIETLRGATTLSQEAIEDKKVLGVDAQIKQEFKEIDVNTANFLISEALNTFPTEDLETVVDVQKALTVGVSSKYAPAAIVNDAFIAEIQSLQYADGRFVFVPSATEEFTGVLFGKKVKIVDNASLGTDEPVLYMLGKKALRYYDRKKVTGEFVQGEHYGKDLWAVVRGAVSKWYADGGKKYTLNLTSTVVETPEGPTEP